MYNEKLWLYTITKEIFQQIKSFRTLIYDGKLWHFVNCKLEKKTMALWEKNYGTMEKLWYYTKNCGTLIYHGTIVNYIIIYYMLL